MIRLSSSFTRPDKHPRHFGRRRLIHPDQPDGHGPRPRLHENLRRSNQPSFERLLAAENQSVLVQSDSRWHQKHVALNGFHNSCRQDESTKRLIIKFQFFRTIIFRKSTKKQIKSSTADKSNFFLNDSDKEIKKNQKNTFKLSISKTKRN